MDFTTLTFTIFCIDNVARALKMPPRDIYHRMQDANIIDGYIVPCYNVLHTFSKEYVVDDLISFMQKKGVLARSYTTHRPSESKSPTYTTHGLI